jgi:hypothetical protein
MSWAQNYEGQRVQLHTGQELQSHMRTAQAATSHCAIINMGPEDVAVRGACVAVRRTGAAQLSTEHSGVDDSARVQKD